MSKSIKFLAAIGSVATIAACAQQEEEFVVVEPEPMAAISRPADWSTCKLPLRLTPTTRSNSSSVYSSNGLRTLIDGEQITTARLPCRSWTPPNAASTASASRMSSPCDSANRY